jgi:hypothetical protein
VRARSAAQRRADAEPYLREALEKHRRTLGEEHPDTLVSVSLLERLNIDENKAQEGLNLIAPHEPAARKVFTGGNARRLAALGRPLRRRADRGGVDAEVLMHHGYDNESIACDETKASLRRNVSARR